jgi:hypothetical protein
MHLPFKVSWPRGCGGGSTGWLEVGVWSETGCLKERALNSKNRIRVELSAIASPVKELSKDGESTWIMWSRGQKIQIHRHPRKIRRVGSAKVRMASSNAPFRTIYRAHSCDINERFQTHFPIFRML